MLLLISGKMKQISGEFNLFNYRETLVVIKDMFCCLQGIMSI